MNTEGFLVLAFFAHYVADFPMQAFFQSIMGKKNIYMDHLMNHVGIYLITFLAIVSLAGWNSRIVLWAVTNAVLHGFIDYFTSRGSHKAHAKALPIEQAGKISQWRGAFWCIIGFDQFLHMATMVITAYLFMVL